MELSEVILSLVKKRFFNVKEADFLKIYYFKYWKVKDLHIIKDFVVGEVSRNRKSYYLILTYSELNKTFTLSLIKKTCLLKQKDKPGREYKKDLIQIKPPIKVSSLAKSLNSFQDVR